MKTSILFLAILLLSFSACQKESETIIPLGNDEVSFRAAPRPFKGTLYTTLTNSVSLSCDCDYIQLSSVGTGNMTHLGRVTSESRPCVKEFFDGGSEVDGVCIRITAANGDELNVDVGPHTNLFNPACLCVEGEAMASFAGGTGRFQDASGSVAIDLSLDVTTGIYTLEFKDGEIFY